MATMCNALFELLLNMSNYRHGMFLYVSMTWLGGCCNEDDVASTSKESSIALSSSCLLVLCVRTQADKERPAFQ